MSSPDEIWMHRALELAERGRGRVEPNPLVGAVIVRDGIVVGEGWHERFGGPHAEVNALAAAGADARAATLYVTLEPCCHHGKTPPCTDAILRTGVSRVVAAMNDPFPAVAGQGAAALRSAGVEVAIGVCREIAERINAPYLTLLRHRRPHVHVKWAMTLDGKIATRTGNSQWISGKPAREFVHQLRGRMDAVIVGAGTVRADNPLLTARPPGPRTPARIVVTRSGRLPRDCQLLKSAHESPVLIATAQGRGRDLRDTGCEILELGDDSDLTRPLFDELGRRQMTNVLVEGGAEMFGSLCDARLIDELHVVIAPCILGGVQSLSPIGGAGRLRIADAWQLADWRHELLGDDLYLHGRMRESNLQKSP